MKFTTLASLIATALLVAGCTSQGMMGGMMNKPTTMDSPRARTMVYKCDTGLMPKITYMNDDTASLSIDNMTTTMNLAVSGSGARYVANSGIFGYGGEWHEKDGQAIFNYKTVDGVSVQSTCMVQ